MLKIENFSKIYGGKTVVKNLNLDVKKGEIFGIVGNNGSGKTTIIKSIVGILEFEKGSIYIDGIDIKKDSLRCKSIEGYAPEDKNIYENLTGISYLNFIADIYEIDKKERQELILKYSGIFGIEGILKNQIITYSQGTRQKLLIISSLIHNAKFLIFDEPFLLLEPKSSYNLKKIIKEFVKNGNTVLFSSHEFRIVESLCDRIGVLNNGEMKFVGNTDEVRKNPDLEKIILELIEDEK